MEKWEPKLRVGLWNTRPTQHQHNKTYQNLEYVGLELLTKDNNGLDNMFEKYHGNEVVVTKYSSRN